MIVDWMIVAATFLLGDVGTAIWNAMIAILTFSHVVLRADLPNWAVLTTAVGGWAVAVFLSSYLILSLTPES